MRTLRSLSEAGASVSATALPVIDAHDPVAILFTSCSTVASKGVLYTPATFQAQVRMLRECYAITPGRAIDVDQQRRGRHRYRQR